MRVWRNCVVVALVSALVPLLAALAADEAKDKPKEGDKGQITGVIEKIDNGKVTIKSEEKTIIVMPRWAGKLPKDGGGFDKDVMAKVATLKVGDKVTVKWTFAEHYRIDSIEKTEKAAAAEAPAKTDK